MKLVVQVPCLNEEETLPLVLSTIPKEIPGIDVIVVLIIDDGSTDRTVEVAREHGVTEFVHHARNRGLGRSFHDGVQRALELGADIEDEYLATIGIAHIPPIDNRHIV